MNNGTTGKTMFYQTRGFNYGWICPICGRVYSPNQPECYNCNQKENSVTATSTTIAMSDYEKAVREQYGGEIRFGKDGKK